MAVPRPLLLAVLGVALAAATFYSTRSAREAGGESTGATAPVEAPRPSRTVEKPKAAHRAQPSPRTTERKGAQDARTGLPAAVARALGRRQVVVLFFRQRGGADDDATAASVRALRRERGGPAVFADQIEDVGHYRRVTQGLDIAQAPAVVIVGRDHRSHLIEGFIDAETLAQQVRDARR